MTENVVRDILQAFNVHFASALQDVGLPISYGEFPRDTAGESINIIYDTLIFVESADGKDTYVTLPIDIVLIYTKSDLYKAPTIASQVIQAFTNIVAAGACFKRSNYSSADRGFLTDNSEVGVYEIQTTYNATFSVGETVDEI